MKKLLLILTFIFISSLSFGQATNSCIVNNAGFENGNTTGWTFTSGGYGVNPPCPTGACPRLGVTLPNGPIAGALNAPVTGAGNRHTLMSTAGGFDANSGGVVPVVAPGGGNYSFRLGNSTTASITIGGSNLAAAEAARLTFLVTPQNAAFTYRYSFFVNNPGHTYVEQPSFQVIVLDQNSAVIPCGGYFVVAGNNSGCVNSAGFVNGINGYVYKPWTDVALDLTGYIGQNVSVEFRTTDCLPAGGSTSISCSGNVCTLTNSNGTCTYTLPNPPCTPTGGSCAGAPGMHSAYAYIDAYCAPLSVVSPAFCAGAASVQICAPAGYASYAWPAGQPGLTGAPTTQCVTINNPIPGAAYTVNMISQTGCPTTTTVTLTGFNFTLNDTTVCAGANPFPLTLTPTGTGNYTYSWTPATGLSCTNCQSPVFTPGSTSTSYTVTMTDPAPGGCTKTDAVNITVQQNTSVTATSATVCAGNNATLSAVGQSCASNVTYSWSPSTYLSSTTSATVTAVNPTSSVTYTVTVTNGFGQTAQTTALLTVNPLPIIAPTGTTVCIGASGTITASGASTYTWTPGGSTGSSLSVNPTTTSTYTVSGTSAFGCVNTNTVLVTVNPLPTITVNSSSICAGQSTTLTGAGGTTYTWSTGATTNPISVSPSTTTSYTVTGIINGCSNTAVATVTVGANILVTANSATVCPGATATLTGVGATTYTWSTGATTASINVNPSTTTNYTVTGATGLCSGVGTAAVTVLPLPTIVTTGTTICNGSAGTISASGASTYTWSPSGATGSSTSVNPTTTSTFSVTGTSTAGCVGSGTVVVTVNPIPTITVNSPPICPGQTATITGAGGTTYSWSTGATTNPISVSPATTTSYTVTGTSLGCSNTAVSTVSVGANMLVSINSPTICAGQSATLTASGGTTYTWSTGATTSAITVNPTSTTSYSVTGITGFCTGVGTSTVTVNPLPVITVNSPTICNGQTAALTANGGTSYVWTAGATSSGVNTANASPTITTTYTVTGTSLGCSSDATSTITVNPIPVVTVNSPTICNGQTAALTANGATTYTWSAGATSSGANTANASPSSTTTFTVIGDALGCINSAIATVTVNPIPVVNVNSPTICAGQIATMTASGATTYTWTTGATSTGVNTATVSPTNNSAYTVTGSSLGCSSNAISNVTVNPNPVVSATADIICQGQNSNLVASGATSYVWSSGTTSTGVNTATANPMTTSIYTVTGTSLGCIGTNTVSVVVNVSPVVTVNSVNICAGQTASLTANGATTYNWSSGVNVTGTNTGDVIPSVTTNYTVTGTSNGCTGSAVATISVTPIPTISANTNAICLGQTATLTATGATTYTWSAGATVSGSNTANTTPTTTTTYTVTGSTNGCVDVDVVTVVVNPIPTALFLGPQAGCTPQTVSFTDSSQGAFSYSWNFGDGSSSSLTSPVHVYSVPGVYSVTLTVTSANGCINTQVQNGIIQVYANPDAQLISLNSSVSEYEPTIYFTDLSTNGSNCMMYFGDGTTFAGCGFNNLGHLYEAAGTYCASIAITTQNGCYDSSVVCVEILPEFTFYIPNAFTPNGSQTNEIFYGYGTNIKEFEMMIFDRWGERIFISNDLNKGWDGKYQEEVAQEDVYVYKVKLKDIFGKKHEYHGTVTLVR